MISVDQAREYILKEARPGAVEKVPLDEAGGRVLARDVPADRDYPPFNRAAMDGFALRAEDFNRDPARAIPVTQEIFAGMVGTPLEPGECAKIMTGAPVPEGADAIIKVEDSSTPAPGMVAFSIAEVNAGRSIARKGEDAREGDVLLRKGDMVSPLAAGTLATVGAHELEVFAPLTAAILSTGDEVVPAAQKPLPHQIRDSNHHSLHHFLKTYGIAPSLREIVPDNPDRLREAAARGLRARILIMTGGVSMGDADFVPEVLADLGVEKIFHKVNIKPGKPLWFGRGPEGTAVFGLPGNPLSCQVGFKVFIEPFIRACLELAPAGSMLLPLGTDRRIKDGREEFFPCSLQTREGRTFIVPTAHRGSGDIKAAARSTGLARQPAGHAQARTGDMLEYRPW